MKDYPSSGDDGQAVRGDGRRVGKDDAHFEAIGAIDELTSTIGWVCVACDEADELAEKLHRVQGELFELAALIAGGKSSTGRSSGTRWLECDISGWASEVGPLKGFILPGGCELAARLHLARVACRRAERRVMAVVNRGPRQVLDDVVPYLNRLSDLLFVWAQWANQDQNIQDVPWQAPGKHPPSKDSADAT